MKILIIGLGSIADKHISAILKIDPRAEIFALRSSKNSKDKQGIVNFYNIEDAQKHDFDFVIISNPTSEHIQTIKDVLVLNCPLFIEKPLGHHLEIDDIVDRALKEKILTYIACNLRFLDALQYVKKYLEENPRRINEVNVYCGSYLPEWRPGTDFRNTYSTQSKMGGGVHIDMIHEMDYVYWLFGKPEDVRKTFRSTSSLDIDAYDYANYCLDYKEFSASMILNYYRKDYKRTMEIVFDDCTWQIDLKRNTVMCGDLLHFSSEQQIIDTYKKQMEYFYQLVNANQQHSFNSMQDAMAVLKLCL